MSNETCVYDEGRIKKTYHVPWLTRVPWLTHVCHVRHDSFSFSRSCGRRRRKFMALLRWCRALLPTYRALCRKYRALVVDAAESICLFCGNVGLWESCQRSVFWRGVIFSEILCRDVHLLLWESWWRSLFSRSLCFEEVSFSLRFFVEMYICYCESLCGGLCLVEACVSVW